MGKFDFEIDPGFIESLGKMADIDRLAPKMIDEAMPILTDNIKSGLSKHGSLSGTIKAKKAGVSRGGGFYAFTGPTGTDEKGVRNMEKAVYLEYGTSKERGSGRKDRQPPRPWVHKAIGASEAQVLEKMQEVFNREVGE